VKTIKPLGKVGYGFQKPFKTVGNRKPIHPLSWGSGRPLPVGDGVETITP